MLTIGAFQWLGNFSDVKKVGTIQRKITRWILGPLFSPYRERLIKLKMLTVSFMCTLLCTPTHTFLAGISAGKFDINWPDFLT